MWTVEGEERVWLLEGLTSRDELPEDSSAPAADAAKHEPVDCAHQIDLPGAVQPETRARDPGDVAEKRVDGNEFEEAQAEQDSVCRLEGEEPGDAGPDEGAEDAEGHHHDVDQGEGGGCHAESCFCEED